MTLMKHLITQTHTCSVDLIPPLSVVLIVSKEDSHIIFKSIEL